MDDEAEGAAIVAANELVPTNLTNQEITDLVGFLHALTDRETIDLRRFVPLVVPSGLPVAD
ncbi:MAG: cytochrome c peroxidase [Verrucomicrobiales bacterium]|jgi:cytochrome c peroxidase